MNERGVILPIFSLDNGYAIGSLGKCAEEFIDWLVKAGQTYWQILPITPIGYGNSPYQAPSVFAGNPYLIDLEKLVADGYLTKNDIEPLKSTSKTVDYDLFEEQMLEVLLKTYTQRHLRAHDFLKFTWEEDWWLNEYAFYQAIKITEGGKPWFDWGYRLRRHQPKDLRAFASDNYLLIEQIKFIQFLFFEQWKDLKQYANDRGIKIIGDLPIYPAHDSSDVWSNPKLFKMDVRFNLTAVAGCPADSFNPEGQLWGNPVYDWEAHAKDNYAWWKKRIKQALTLFDVIRIDHFRGFSKYYEIPIKKLDAKAGTWQLGPGEAFFEHVFEGIAKERVIAENLGHLDKEVDRLLKATGFSGMKVMQFELEEFKDYRTFKRRGGWNNVYYSSTHDTPDLATWFLSHSEEWQSPFIQHFKCWRKNVPHELLKALYQSSSRLVMVQYQDLLGIKARINEPGTTAGNWTYRINSKDLTLANGNKVKRLMAQ